MMRRKRFAAARHKRIAALALAASAAAALFFSGCGGEKPDGTGWYSSLETAKKLAQRQGKSILLFVNSAFDAEGTDAAVRMLLENPDFVRGVQDKYVCVHFDFTQAAGDSAVIPEGATSREQKAAEAKSAEMQRQFRAADLYGVQPTPAALLATKEGYFISSVDFDYYSDSAEEYINVVEGLSGAVADMNALVAAAKKGPNRERVRAIDALYEAAQSDSHRLLFADLYRRIPRMDKKDESGLVSKYICAAADADAYARITAFDLAGAAGIYTKAAADSRVSAADRQVLYYSAVNVLAASGSGDYAAILDLLQKSYDAEPSSVYAEGIRQAIGYLNQLQEQEKAQAEAEAANAK